jgi:hypothetical protein
LERHFPRSQPWKASIAQHRWRRTPVSGILKGGGCCSRAGAGSLWLFCTLGVRRVLDDYRRDREMRHSTCLALIVLSTCCALPADAFKSGAPATGLPNAADYSSTILPELSGVVSWKALAQVEPVNRGGKMVPEFSREILGLDKQVVRIYGFMLPLDMTDQQKHFLISAVPASCPFCMPAGPEAIVEVMSSKAVKFGIEPIIMAGRLSLLKDDQSGMLYRMTEAELVPTSVK